MNGLVFAIVALTTIAYTAVAKGGLDVRVTKPLARRTSSGHTASSNILKLNKGTKASKSSFYLKALRATSTPDRRRHDYGAVPMVDLLSAEYIAEIAWSGIPMNVLIDTGSSDSWLVQDGFTCVDQDNRTQPVGLRLPKFDVLLTMEYSSKPLVCSARLLRAHSTPELFQTSTLI